MRGLGPNHVECRKLAASHLMGAIGLVGLGPGTTLRPILFLAFFYNGVYLNLTITTPREGVCLCPWPLVCVKIRFLPRSPLLHSPLSGISRGNILSAVRERFLWSLTWTLLTSDFFL